MPARNDPGYDTEQIENDLAALRGQVDLLSEYMTGTDIYVSDFIGMIISGTVETWHPIGSLSNSWTIPSGGWLSYRLTIQNELQLTAWIQAPAASVNGPTIATIPGGYRPLNTHGLACGADVANANFGPFVHVNSSGQLVSSGVGANANVYINGKIPLDV